MARTALASPCTTCVSRSLCIDMSPIVSVDALTKPYNSTPAELRATTACVLHHILTRGDPATVYPPVVLRRVLQQPAQSVSENVSSWHGVFEICPQPNPESVFQIPPQYHHLLPICCCWRCQCDVSTPLRNCLVCQGQEKLAIAANALYRVVSTGLKICPINVLSFMPNFPNFLFSTISSVLSRTSSLFSLDIGIFKDVKLDAPVFAGDCFCVFPICSTGYPDSLVLTELSIQYHHLLRHSWFVPEYCSIDFQLGLQLVSRPNKTHWFS